MKKLSRVSIGLKGLDEAIDCLRLGDNVVWRVGDIEDYRYFVQFLLEEAGKEKKEIHYMRFASHKPLLGNKANVVIHKLDAESGFESFSIQVHNIIKEKGEGAYYVFDCLSDLLPAWASDLMVGNFFTITCPYLYELDTIAYFAIVRGSHTFKTVARIRETTQILMDIYNDEGRFYVHPLKVWQRYSPTMFLPHLKADDEFIPIINSVDAANLFSDISQKESEKSTMSLDYWDRLFLRAEEIAGDPSMTEERDVMVGELSRVIITREPRMMELVKKHTTLDDLLYLRRKLIGSGFIGGKAVGMLLARKILINEESYNWRQYLEPHDSFYIGADVFYTYLVQNGWWRLRVKQKTTEGYFKAAFVLKEKMLKGEFPEEIKEQFIRMIEYFGQSPIIVRSSSLLEDSFGNAFAGKYESIFCVNQGTPEERYKQFEDAVRKIYASMMNPDALIYRLQRGLEQADEQMALLVQRVSGSYRQHYFFPDVAGVGVSHNTFVWKKEMDPKAGMLRIVFGLGTRAVDRTEGDYPRVVALDVPELRPHAGMDDTRKYSQHDVDVMDVKKNKFETVSLLKLMGERLGIRMDRIGIMDHETNRRIKEFGIKDEEAWIINFDDLLTNTPFPEIMQKMLQKLESTYQYPVDIEFTVNFTGEDKFKINVLQCRPLQTIGREVMVEVPENIENDRTLMKLESSFFGGSISQSIKRIIYVIPSKYIELPLTKKYGVARLVGRLNRQIVNKDDQPVMLLGPGRWGTTTPSLGVPVSFSEINNITVMGEIAYEGGNLMPELSFGTHFFQDLVETGVFYIALFPQEKEVIFNNDLIFQYPNILEELAPEFADYKDIVWVCDVGNENLKLVADVVSQKVISYFENKK